MLNVELPEIQDLLTSQESAELEQIQGDPSVVGYAVLSPLGEEIEVGGLWSDTIAAVFANVFDLANSVGAEFGEASPCAIVIMESGEFEIAGLTLSRARVVIVKRKGRNAADTSGGLRSVS